MPDRSTRQTLCIMPQTQEKPTSFRDIEDGNFWIINDQHSVEASKTMQGMDVPLEHSGVLPDLELLHSVD